MSIHVRPKLLVFDIIETVMSLETMRSRFEAIGQLGTMLETWFASGLRDAFAIALTGGFQPFQHVLLGALDQLLGDTVSQEHKKGLVAGMADLEPHDDAMFCFRTLTDAGFRIAALSNGAAATTRKLLASAGLEPFVEFVGSVEDAHVSKPKADVYYAALAGCGVRPSEASLVACHAWDVAGAMAVGMKGVFVARGALYPQSMRKPDLIVQTLAGAAEALVRLPL